MRKRSRHIDDILQVSKAFMQRRAKIRTRDRAKTVQKAMGGRIEVEMVLYWIADLVGRQEEGRGKPEPSRRGVGG